MMNEEMEHAQALETTEVER